MTVKSWIKWWVPSGLLTTIRKVKKNTNGKPPPQLQKGSPLPRRSLTDLFPGIESENITLSVEGFFLKDEYLLPIHEYLALMSICRHRKPSRIFEFGTYIGLTTLGLAMNTPEDTEIFTLDLDPSTRQTHKHGLGIGGFPSFEVGSMFANSPYSRKIKQLLGDSQSFDFKPYHGAFDLILIDADHSYAFVKSDTTNAFQLLRTGGIIIWDDYQWNDSHPECAGVSKCINELSATKKVFELDQTRFAAYIPI